MSEYVLIVDDSPTVRAAAEFALAEKGFEVKTAENGLDGLDKIESIHLAGDKVSIIISDVNMPEMDGLTFVKTVKKSSFKDIPVLFLTTESQRSVMEEGKKTGAVGWLVKPFTSAQLSSVIRKFVKTEEAVHEKPPVPVRDLFSIFANEMIDVFKQLEESIGRLNADAVDTKQINEILGLFHHLRMAATFINYTNIIKFVFMIEELVLMPIINNELKTSENLAKIISDSLNVLKRIVFDDKGAVVKENIDELKTLESDLKECVEANMIY
jgi:two-component system chemotaxis response regulator CheY